MTTKLSKDSNCIRVKRTVANRECPYAHAQLTSKLLILPNYGHRAAVCDVITYWLLTSGKNIGCLYGIKMEFTSSSLTGCDGFYTLINR